MLACSDVLNSSCRFTPNVFHVFSLLSPSVAVCLGEKWYWGPAQQLKCNGYSQCLCDGCDCHGVDVFFCADKRGCVTLQKVCDIIPDCLDGSDERICPYLHQLEFKNTTISISESFYCKGQTIGYTAIYPSIDVQESGFIEPNCTYNTTALTNCTSGTFYRFSSSLDHPLDHPFSPEVNYTVECM